MRSDPSIKDKSFRNPAYVDIIYSIAERLLEAAADYVGSLPPGQRDMLDAALRRLLREEYARRLPGAELPDLSGPLGPELLERVWEAAERAVEDGKAPLAGEARTMPEAERLARLLAAEVVIHATMVFLSYVGTVRLA